MYRLLLIASIFVAGLASGLVAFVLTLFAWMAGLQILWVAIAAVAVFHTYMCGLTLEHLKRGDDAPWTGLAAGLVLITTTVGVVFRFG